MTGLVPSLAAAASALAAGAALVGAGVAWAPPRESNTQVLLRGAEVYAAECAGCHGGRLEGRAAWMLPGAGNAALTPLAPPLGASGHAWARTPEDQPAPAHPGTNALPDPARQQPHSSRRTKAPRSRKRASLAPSKSRGRVSIRHSVPKQAPSASLTGYPA